MSENGEKKGPPENDPVIIDNPEMVIDLLNYQRAPNGPGPHGALTRVCRRFVRLVVEDEGNTQLPVRTIALQPGAGLQLRVTNLHVTRDVDVEVDATAQELSMAEDVVPAARLGFTPIPGSLTKFRIHAQNEVFLLAVRCSGDGTDHNRHYVNEWIELSRPTDSGDVPHHRLTFKPV